MSGEIIPTDNKKIVLGHPFSGALYAYFDKEINQGRGIESSKYHSYYKTLYGNHFNYYIDLSLTLSLIYDTVILPAADNHFPESHKYQHDGEYYNPEFGLYLTWNDEASFRYMVDDRIQKVLGDPQISDLLWNIPRHAHQQIIHEVFFELAMAKKFDATLFTLGKRQSLALRIIEIEKEKEPDFSEKTSVRIISSYLDITGLLFQPMDIQSFYYLKTEKELREYSSSFLKLIERFSPEDPKNIRNQLLLLIKEAISKDKLNSKISGIFESGSNLMNFAGLIPTVIPVASLISIGANIASKGIDNLNNKNKWFEFAGQIQKTMSLKKIDDAVKNI